MTTTTTMIKEAIAAFGQQFQEAFAGNKETGAITGPLLKFLLTPDLPPYFKMKANLALSGADEEEEPWENLAVCRHHLNAAEKALAECMEVYKDAGDVQRLRMIETLIEEERSALLERQRAT
ncbi:hypothetical protein Q7P35_001588 [Cladosporium inversicolor]